VGWLEIITIVVLMLHCHGSSANFLQLKKMTLKRGFVMTNSEDIVIEKLQLNFCAVDYDHMQ